VSRGRLSLKLGVFALVLAFIAVGCAKAPEFEKRVAEDMIRDARAAGAYGPNVINAEKYLNQGVSEMEAREYEMAKASFESAFAEATVAYSESAREECPPLQTCECPEREVNIHVVVRGDTLWDIAKEPRYYNDPFQWRRIWEANMCNIVHNAECNGAGRCHYHYLYPGQYLVIPDAWGDLEMQAVYRRDHASDWDRTRDRWY